MSDILIAQLQDLLGPGGLLLGERVSERPRSYIESAVPCAARAIVRPATTEQLAEVLRLCYEDDQPVVPIGGGTGLVQGCTASSREIQLSLERLTAVEEVDTAGRTLTVQAGATLQAAQEAAAERGLMLPLDIGARGSATIGGVISTNAGGNQVLRYGMARESVLGLEAVLADGTIVASMNRMIKNNAGYDIKQLFVGTEGTLGIVTRAVLRLRELPRSRDTALVALTSFSKLMDFLKQVDAALGGALSAFEVMWDSFYRMVTEPPATNQPPFSTHYPFYVLVESQGGDQAADSERFLNALMAAMDAGLVADAVVAKSSRERDAIWAMRDDVEHFFCHKPWYGFDVSLPIGDMEAYIDQVKLELSTRWPGYKHVIFGHVADSNIHILISAGGGSQAEREVIEQIVYGCLRPYGGSISAEHGIGLEKRPYLSLSRNPSEMAVMRCLKRSFDPKGILNPGRVLEMTAEG